MPKPNTLIRQKPRLFTLLFRAIELNAMGLKKHRIGSKPSVFWLEPLNKRKAEHLIAHLGCKYDSNWDATFHAVEHFTVVILVSRTNGTRRLNRVLNDPRTIVQIERRYIGVEALSRVMDRKRKGLIGILLHPILARPEDP